MKDCEREKSECDERKEEADNERMREMMEKGSTAECQRRKEGRRSAGSREREREV